MQATFVLIAAIWCLGSSAYLFREAYYALKRPDCFRSRFLRMTTARNLGHLSLIMGFFQLVLGVWLLIAVVLYASEGP